LDVTSAAKGDATASRCLRLAFVTETYPPEINGVSLSVAQFVDGLLARGHTVQVIRPRQHADRASLRREHPPRPNLHELPVAGLPIPRYPELKMGLPAGRLLEASWSATPPDLVHIVTEGPLGWSALMTARRLGLPVTSDFRTNFHVYSRHYGVGLLEGPAASYLRWFHNHTLATLVPSRHQFNALRQLGIGPLEVVARGVDTQLFNTERRSPALRRSWGAGPDDLVVLYVGRLAPEKNIPLLARAFQAMQASRPDARLVLVGDGPGRAALMHQFPEAVFAGVRRGEDLAAHYASGDVFLFPSLTETFGNVTLEAMASGLALLAYDYAAAAEHVRHGKNGFLAPYNDEAAFVRVAGEIAANPAAWREAGAAARSSALNLDWERVVRLLESLFLSVAARSKAQPGLALGANPGS
jgi:glycosyltransferase involved in cell wall biosynthesis